MVTDAGTTPENKRDQDQERAERCRNYVIEHVVNLREELAVAEIAALFKRSVTAVRNDVYKHVYERMQQPVGIRGQTLVYDASRLTTEGRRGHEDVPEKSMIGRLGAEIILGPAHWNGIDLEDALSSQRVQDMKMSQATSDKFEAYFRKAHRLAILDSGTTTLAIGNELTKCKTPDTSRQLNFLRILTNGRRVAEALDVSESPHGIILLGGALRRDTKAVVGLLAVRCLESWLVRTSDSAIADVAIIGTTSVNRDFDMFSDSEDESEMKSRLLSSARIKCVCAAATKLMRPSGGSSAFSRFSSQMIDMVITDEGILKKQRQTTIERARQAFLIAARKQGIYVAVAPKSTTNDRGSKIGIEGRRREGKVSPKT